MATLFGMFPLLKTLFADNGYHGSGTAQPVVLALLRLRFAAQETWEQAAHIRSHSEAPTLC